MTRADPLRVPCPSCGAVAGDRCWSGTRRGRKLARGSHADRVRSSRGEHVAESFQTHLRREIDRVTAEVIGNRGRKV